MNSKARAEISAVMREAAVSFSEVDGKLHPVYTHESDYVMSVISMDALIEKIIRTNEKLFAIKTNAFSKQKYIAATPLGRSLLNALNTDVPGVRTCFGIHEFSPRFELFVRNVKDRDLDLWLALRKGYQVDGLTKDYDTLCGLVSALREEGRRARFKAQLRRFRRGTDKNYLSLYRYLRKTLAVHSRINVCRYQLCYQKESADIGSMNQPCSMQHQESKSHREALIKAMRKGLVGKHLIGYAWSMEQSTPRGFQHHLLLVLDEASLEIQALVAAALKEAWNGATETKGLLVDCSNLHPAFKSTGTGLIESTSKEAWAIFRKICFQMTQADNFIKLSLPGAARTFGKAELNEKRSEATVAQ